MNRTLDRGNPNPGNLGADFGRFGLKFWDELADREPKIPEWRRGLEQLNEWRNAIAHNHYDPTRLGVTMTLSLNQVREWRRINGRLTHLFDTTMAEYLESMIGARPW